MSETLRTRFWFSKAIFICIKKRKREREREGDMRISSSSFAGRCLVDIHQYHQHHHGQVGEWSAKVTKCTCFIAMFVYQGRWLTAQDRLTDLFGRGSGSIWADLMVAPTFKPSTEIPNGVAKCTAIYSNYMQLQYIVMTHSFRTGGVLFCWDRNPCPNHSRPIWRTMEDPVTTFHCRGCTGVETAFQGFRIVCSLAI